MLNIPLYIPVRWKAKECAQTSGYDWVRWQRGRGRVHQGRGGGWRKADMVTWRETGLSAHELICPSSASLSHVQSWKVRRCFVIEDLETISDIIEIILFHWNVPRLYFRKLTKVLLPPILHWPKQITTELKMLWNIF